MAGTFDTQILRQPRWIVAIILGILISLLFVRLGMWQLDRLGERRAANAVIEGRMAEPTRPLDGIVGQYGTDVDSIAHRHAATEGTFRTEAEFFSVGRTYDDLTGTLVATPLDLADGSVLIVVRGLVPPETLGPPAVGYQPASVPMSVKGVLLPGEEPSRIGEPDPENGELTSLSRIDLDYIDTWVDGDVLPVMMSLEEWSMPNPEGTPEPIPAQELTEGSHLGYAVQWFAFAMIVVIGVGFLVYRAGTDATISGTGTDRTSRA